MHILRSQPTSATVSNSTDSPPSAGVGWSISYIRVCASVGGIKYVSHHCPMAVSPQIGGLSVTVADVLVFVFSFPNFSPIYSEAWLIFQPGETRGGWFTADHLLNQVDHAIDIFEDITNGYAQALFLFDNAPSHPKCVDDVLSACLMVKGVSFFISQIYYLTLSHVMIPPWPSLPMCPDAQEEYDEEDI